MKYSCRNSRFYPAKYGSRNLRGHPPLSPLALTDHDDSDHSVAAKLIENKIITI